MKTLAVISVVLLALATLGVACSLNWCLARFCKLVLLALAALAVAAWILFTDRRATVATLADADIGDVRVLGESEDRFEDWSFSLFWRKGNGPWMEYLLDRQVSFWSDVTLLRLSNAVAVIRCSEIIGTLSTADGSFSNRLRARLETHPRVIIISDDPFHKTNRIYPGDTSWKSVWPTTALQYK